MGGLAMRAALLGAIWIVAAAPAAQADTATFTSTGNEQTFTIPQNVSALHVVATGGRGGDNGGYGATATADVPVTAGQTVYVEVGANGEADNPGGPTGSAFNGGGIGVFGAGGGGASDIRSAPRANADSLSSRMVVAAGGGGTGSGQGVSGGSAGAAGQAGGGCSSDGVDVTGGQPATATAGGPGGTPGGTAGTLGQGGRDPSGSGGGAGGGGGLYGGGSGGFEPPANNSCGGGGGGGSSGFGSTATNTAVAADTTGVPSVTITYTVVPPPSDGGGTQTPPPDGGGGTPPPPPAALGDVALPAVQRGAAVTGAATIGLSNSIFRADLYGDAPKFKKAPKVAKRIRLGQLLKAPVKAGLMSFTVRLNKQGKAALKRLKKLKLTLKITVTPPNGAAVVKTKVVTVRLR